ncbi:hypothetical protein [Aeromonas dhakensis]|uniref:hypothetical protein n=1 Tax=Aeromonas dhakensis TaxID=196024 RepID=UPI0018A77BF7|nr:hypothetical protein [Aeromonas dhakensis]MBF8449565.1 hypothetical protein [Aeromonas dhakensis]HDZ8844649.1 hypothetical protein [Aeromonas dhakensis]
MPFMEIVSAISGTLSIAGVSVKDLIKHVTNSDKQLLEKYFEYLENRLVLVAPFDKEVSQAVIKSLESIKDETENLRGNINSDFSKHILLDLIHKLSTELMALYKYQGDRNEVLFYKVLQSVRGKFARSLSLLCASYTIDLSLRQTALSNLVLQYAYKGR